MRRFFTEPDNVDRESASLVIYEDASHISRVLRMQPGDMIKVFDGSGFEYEAEIEEISERSTRCKIKNSRKSSLEPTTKVTLFQGIPKSGKLDVIVQKAVELGVFEVVPVSMSRSVARIEGPKSDKKIERLNKISREAAKQCGRGVVPAVTVPVNFDELIARLGEFDLGLMLYEELGHDGKRDLKRILRSDTGREAVRIAVIVGPEGGLADEEAEAFLALGGGKFFAAGLGERILRTETAGSTALSIIMYEKDEI